MGSRSAIRTDFTRGEQTTGLAWLCLGAAFSALLEIVYLDTHIAGFPFPYTIVVALLFNAVLTRTAKLWTSSPWVALIPLAAWVAVFFVLMFGVQVTGDMLVGNNIRTIVLLAAGVCGGVLPLLRGK